jgi:hypothetical protein
MARRSGKIWLEFVLYGLQWEARVAPAKSKVLDRGKTLACVLHDQRVMYFADTLSDEQLSTALAHEVQHVIEEHADVDYTSATDTGDRMTDQVARGWLYIIRDCAPLMEVFQRKVPL